MKKILIIIIIFAALGYVGYTKYRKSKLEGIWTIFDENQQKYVPVLELRDSGYAAFYSNFLNFDCEELLKDGSFSLKKGKILTLNYTVRIKKITYQETNYAERMAYGDNAKRSQKAVIENVEAAKDLLILSLNNEELIVTDYVSEDSGQGSEITNKIIFKKQR